MTNALATLNKLYVYIGLTGFSGCYLSFFLSLNKDLKSSLNIEKVSTFLLGTASTGVLLARPLPEHIFLNILISVSTGMICSFLPSRFLKIGL